MATVMYPYDDTGTAPSNLVKDEIQVLTASNNDPYRYFIPMFAPFYMTNFEMFGKDALGSERKLEFGVDYNFNLLYIGATRGNGSAVYGAVEIINAQIQGPVRLNYQCLGGKYSVDRDYVVQVIAEQNYNPRVTAWDQVTSIQELFPPSNHPQDLDTFTGYRDLIDAIDRLDGANDTQPIKDLLWSHILDHNDPHKTLDLLNGYATKEYVDQTDQALTSRMNANDVVVNRHTQEIIALQNGIIDDGNNYQQQITENKQAIAATNARVDQTDQNVTAVSDRLTVTDQRLTGMIFANQGRIDGLNSQMTDMNQRIASVESAISIQVNVPQTKISELLISMLPHMRFMIWDSESEKYIRAPWHQPGMLHYSYHNPNNGITGYLPVDGVTSYTKADYPDLVDRLGLDQDEGTFILVDMRGEFLRVLDNGRGLDINRVNLSSQASQNLTHTHTVTPNGATGSIDIPSFTTDPTVAGTEDGFFYEDEIDNIVSQTLSVTMPVMEAEASGGTEARPQNIAVPLWISI